MFDGGSNFQNDLYQNIPSMALMFAAISPIFGNGSFVIQPASPGEVQAGFASVPYTPLEAFIYQQQNSNTQVAPTSITGGSNTGQQVITSTQTANDATGTARVLFGNQQKP
jgi:hypothetical protein